MQKKWGILFCFLNSNLLLVKCVYFYNILITNILYYLSYKQKFKGQEKKVWLRKFHSNEYIYVCFFSYIENRSNFWMKVWARRPKSDVSFFERESDLLWHSFSIVVPKLIFQKQSCHNEDLEIYTREYMHFHAER